MDGDTDDTAAEAPVAAGNGRVPPGRLVTIDYQGHTYTFDADTVTIDALEEFEDRQYIRAVRSILGAEQWATYKARHPLAADVNGFVTALLGAAGALGNPSASSVS